MNITYCYCLGIGGIYKGVTATIMKQGSNQAIRFFVMETLKDFYRGGDPKKQIPTLAVGAMGAVAGMYRTCFASNYKIQLTFVYIILSINSSSLHLSSLDVGDHHRYSNLVH